MMASSSPRRLHGGAEPIPRNAGTALGSTGRPRSRWGYTVPNAAREEALIRPKTIGSALLRHPPVRAGHKQVKRTGYAFSFVSAFPVKTYTYGTCAIVSPMYRASHLAQTV